MGVAVETYLLVILSLVLFLFVLKLISQGISSISLGNTLGMPQDISSFYTTYDVEYFTMEYLTEWLKEEQHVIKPGDSFFLFCINYDALQEIVSTRGKSEYNDICLDNHPMIISLALREYDSKDFSYIHQFVCNDVSPDLLGLDQNGIWFNYSYPIKRIK